MHDTRSQPSRNVAPRMMIRTAISGTTTYTARTKQSWTHGELTNSASSSYTAPSLSHSLDKFQVGNQTAKRCIQSYTLRIGLTRSNLVTEQIICIPVISITCNRSSLHRAVSRSSALPRTVPHLLRPNSSRKKFDSKSVALQQDPLANEKIFRKTLLRENFGNNAL